MTDAGGLLVATLALPLALLAACVSQAWRRRVSRWLFVAALPALAAALFAGDSAPVVLDSTRYRLTLALDREGALLLGVAALLWSAAGAYATTYLAADARAHRFAEWWLLTGAGSLGVFVAADLASFYITFAMLSLAAWGLVVHDDTPAARRAGVVYLALAVAGEILLLLAFALLAANAPGDSLLIRDVVAALPGSPTRDLTLALLVAGFGLKAGIVPLHVWLPLAHPAAPMPASAVLSGAILKAGVIGWIRFLPFEAALPAWGGALAAAGLLSAFYAVAVGVTQQHPKTVLAYSSVSQLGVIAAVLGTGLAAGDAQAPFAASFYAVHHLLAKGALFLAVGVVAAGGASHAAATLALALLLGLGLGGLPLSGGALAKLAIKAPLGSGLAGTLAAASAAGTTLLMLHFALRLRAFAAQDPAARPGWGLLVPWWVLAAASLALPWLLAARQDAALVAEALSPAAWREALGPMLVGAALAFVLARWGRHLPRVPEGDIVVGMERAVRASAALAVRVEAAESWLARWPVAGISLLALALALGVAMGVRA